MCEEQPIERCVYTIILSDIIFHQSIRDENKLAINNSLTNLI
jgi:hypothetical protein